MLGKIRTFSLQIRSLTLYPIELQAHMIQKGTYLNVLDNTGVRRVKCITSANTNQRGVLRIGSIIHAVVRDRKTRRPKSGSLPSLGEKVYAVIVQTKRSSTRIDGSKISYGQNGVVLVSLSGRADSRRPDKLSGATPLGTRVLEPVAVSLRHRLPGLGVKILSMTKSLV